MAVRRIASVAIATATQSVLTLALSIVLARLLGPAGRGSYALLTLTAMTGATVGTFGFGNATVYLLGRQPERARGILAACLLVAGVSGVTVAGLLIWLTAGSAPLFPPAAQELVPVASVAIPFLILTALLNGVLIGLGRVSDSAWLGAAGVALLLLIVLMAALAPMEMLAALVWAFTLAALAQACILLVLATRTVGGPLADPRPAVAGGMGYGLVSHAAVVLHVLHLRADVFLVSFFLGPREVGLYALAQAVCELVWLLPRSAATVLFPFVAGSEEGRAIGATTRTSRVVFSLAGVAALCLGLVASWLIPTLFGEAFSGSVMPIRLLLPGIWAGSIAGSLSAFLGGRGRPDLPLLTTTVSLVSNLALNVALIPRYGIPGAAVASAVTYALMTAVNALLARRVAAIRIADLLLLQKADVVAVLHEIRYRWTALQRDRT